jgi:hypothetical protein
MSVILTIIFHIFSIAAQRANLKELAQRKVDLLSESHGSHGGAYGEYSLQECDAVMSGLLAFRKNVLPLSSW